MTRLFANPALYVAWTVAVVLALVGGWLMDPYAFAFVTLIAGAGTMVIGMIGIVMQLRVKDMPINARRILAISVAASAAVVFIALVLLSRIHWA